MSLLTRVEDFNIQTIQFSGWIIRKKRNQFQISWTAASLTDLWRHVTLQILSDMTYFQLNKYSSWQWCLYAKQKWIFCKKDWRTHSPLRFISKFFCYLLWAAECMSLGASDPQLQNTSLLLRKIHTTILGSLTWNGSLQVRCGVGSFGWLFCHLSNDVSILSMHLCNCTKISDDTEHLIDLKSNAVSRYLSQSYETCAKIA